LNRHGARPFAGESRNSLQYLSFLYKNLFNKGYTVAVCFLGDFVQTAIVNKWGNAKAIRLPSDFCRQLGISEGDTVSLEIVRDKIVLSSAKPKMPYNIKERIKFWDGVRDASGELDWGPDTGKEIWWKDEK
jgi:antitoxin component of MazEF toxin-antitoxin module